MKKRTSPADFSRLLFTTEYTAIWLAALIGLSLSWAALWIIQQQLEAHKRLDFEWVAHNRVRGLKHGIERGLDAVTIVRDFFRGSERVDAKAFEVFASSLLARHKGIQALMWLPLVPRKAREQFEKSQSMPAEPFRITEPIGHFELAPANERTVYIPITYIVPRKVNEYSLGLDLGLMPFFKELSKRALGSGEMAASGRIAYVDKVSGVEYGFMAVLPVFDNKPPKDAQAQQNPQLLGFAAGLFRLGDLTDAAIALLEPRGVDILIRDESASPGEQFLHLYASRLELSDSASAGWKDEDAARYTGHIRVADRKWSVICVQTPNFRSAEAFKQGPLVVLFAGLLFTLLLSFYLAHIKENARERMAMQQQLVESEELFRQMMETVDEVFWAVTADATRLLYLSPAYEGIFGGPPSLENGQGSMLPDAVPEEDRAQLVEALEQIQRKKVVTEVIHRVTRIDGTNRWVRTRGFPVLDKTGQIHRIVGFIEDITERKLADEVLRDSESKLRDTFQQSPDIIMTVDGEGKILLLNRSIATLPADLEAGGSSLALVPAEFHNWYLKALEKAFRKGETEHFQYSTEESQYWEGRIVPIRGEGPITAAMVVATDVTEKQNLELQALRNARLASVGVLAAGVAHEINNPNNSIMFNASLVAKAWKDATPILMEYYRENGDFSLAGLSFSEVRDTFPQLLSEISLSAERIKRIVQNLKHMARQDTGQFNENVDIQQVLEATMMILHNQIQKYTDFFKLAVPDDLPLVRGNSQQLEQVFINVLLNALQSLPDRTKGVFIHADRNGDGEYLAITIRDEGQGIPERDLSRVTEPFFTSKSDAGGTGLGLSISQSIMEKHAGSIRFQSEPGKGTTVTIGIPVVHPE